MNPLLLIGAGIACIIAGIKQLPEKELTNDKSNDNVGPPSAKSVPVIDENPTDSNDSGDQSDSGDAL